MRKLFRKIRVFLGMILWRLKSKKEKDTIIQNFNDEVLEEARKITGIRKAMKNAGKRYARTKGFSN